MPPKKRAATKKQEAVDVAAGGDVEVKIKRMKEIEDQPQENGNDVEIPETETVKAKGKPKNPKNKKEVVEKISEDEPTEKPIKKGRKKAVHESEDEEEPSEKPMKKGRKKPVPEDENDEETDKNDDKPPMKKARNAKKFDVKETLEEPEIETKTKRTATKKMKEEIPLREPSKRAVKQKVVQEVEEPKIKEKKTVKAKTQKAPVAKKATKKKVTESNDEEIEKKSTKSTKAPKKKVEREPTPGPSNINNDDNSKNQASTDWESINFTCNKVNAEGVSPNLKITSWNVDGLRAWIKKDGLNILKYCTPDIFCVQETKCTEDKLPQEELSSFKEYHQYWCSSEKNGYAGVGLFSIIKPINVTYGINNEEHDSEGRCITAEYKNFYLVTTYVPNAGRQLVTLDKRLEWNEIFKTYIQKLDETKPVIICGDLNVAHNEIDLKNPKTNKKNAGFTQEERDGMTDFLDVGFIDTFRLLYPNQEDVYTFWTYVKNSRKNNVGWRLDYFLISKRLEKKICDNVVHDQVYGSDHCPLTLYLNI